MSRCTLSVSNADYTFILRDMVRSFMTREYNTHYHIDMDRKHGIMYFDLPKKDFDEKYRKLEEQLVGPHPLRQFKRARITLNHDN